MRIKLLAMLRHELGRACVFVVCFGLIALPVVAQDAVDLQLRLERGEVLYFAATTSFQTSMRFPEVAPTTSAVQAEGRLAMRVLDVDQDGTILVESTVEDLRVTLEGQLQESIDTPALFRIRRDGRIVEWKTKPALAAFEGVENFPSILPGHTVKVGDSWTAPFALQTALVKVEGTSTFTFAGIEVGSQGRIARLRMQQEGTAQPGQLPPMPSGFQVQIQGTLGSTGEVEWLIERGRLFQSHEDGTVEFSLRISGNGRTADGSMTLQYTNRVSAIAPESVVPPSIPADRLITPGKAVGDVSLDLPVSALRAKLGGPGEPVAPDTFKLGRVVWGRLIAAYVDPADQDRVLGLDVGDKQYRTDKGIGFGASRGAVLFAYGMSPVILDLVVPAGGVQVLIYNDLGVAFVLTSDAQHASARGTHAPIGAVDWITIFRPGDAGKIFNLP